MHILCKKEEIGFSSNSFFVRHVFNFPNKGAHRVNIH